MTAIAPVIPPRVSFPGPASRLPGLGRRLPLVSLYPARQRESVYGVAAVDHRGLIIAHTLLRCLG